MRKIIWIIITQRWKREESNRYPEDIDSNNDNSNCNEIDSWTYEADDDIKMEIFPSGNNDDSLIIDIYKAGGIKYRVRYYDDEVDKGDESEDDNISKDSNPRKFC